MRKKTTTIIIASNSPEETFAFGRRIAEKLVGGERLLLTGNLGSGKTCFVQGLAEGLGIRQQVNSPTYVYMHDYVMPQTKNVGSGKQSMKFYHIDLYRVQEILRLDQIGLTELLNDPHSIMAIEWPALLEHMSFLTKNKILRFSFERISATKRKITME